jgi:WD40 repeat protein
MTVPADAMLAAIDPNSPAIAYSVGSELFCISELHELKRMRSHTRTISAITFSSCGHFILSGDVTGNIKIERVSNGKVFQFEGVRSPVTSAAFVNAVVAVGTLSGKIFVFQLGCQRVLRILAFHTAGVTFLSIHPNCEYIGSVSMDGSIRLCSISLGACVRVWKSPRKVLLSCRFSNDGKMIIVACSDGGLSIIDLGTTKTCRTLSIEAAVIDAIFSPNDQMIAVVDKTGGFSLWDSNDLAADSLIVLRIEKIRPITLDFRREDEIKVVGCIAPARFFDDGLSAV